MVYICIYNSSLERCLSIEQSKGTHGKLQEQLERVKTEMNSLYNQTEEFMQYSGQILTILYLLFFYREASHFSHL